jgi:hypothetical protein
LMMAIIASSFRVRNSTTVESRTTNSASDRHTRSWRIFPKRRIRYGAVSVSIAGHSEDIGYRIVAVSRSRPAGTRPKAPNHPVPALR